MRSSQLVARALVGVALLAARAAAGPPDDLIAACWKEDEGTRLVLHHPGDRARTVWVAFVSPAIDGPTVARPADFERVRLDPAETVRVETPRVAQVLVMTSRPSKVLDLHALHEHEPPRGLLMNQWPQEGLTTTAELGSATEVKVFVRAPGAVDDAYALFARTPRQHPLEGAGTLTITEAAANEPGARPLEGEPGREALRARFDDPASGWPARAVSELESTWTWSLKGPATLRLVLDTQAVTRPARVTVSVEYRYVARNAFGGESGHIEATVVLLPAGALASQRIVTLP